MRKAFYIFLGAILGVIISIFVHALIEGLILWWSGYSNTVIKWTQLSGQNYCVLPFWLITLLPILGIILGGFFGFLFYHKTNKRKTKK